MRHVIFEWPLSVFLKTEITLKAALKYFRIVQKCRPKITFFFSIPCIYQTRGEATKKLKLQNTSFLDISSESV